MPTADFTEEQQAALTSFRCVVCHSPIRRIAGGLSCVSCGHCHPVDRDGIIHALRIAPSRLTPAQSLGQWMIAARLYEPIWRRSALTRLSGTPLPPEREWDLVQTALGDPIPDLVLDNASGSGFLGRAIAHRMNQRGRGVVVANDLSLPMLREGMRRAKQEGIAHRILFVQAASEHLPFRDGTFGGIVCGGTMNEFRSASIVLAELARVVRPENGRAYIMAQTAGASGWRASFQRMLGAALGLTVRSVEATLEMFGDRWNVRPLLTAGLITAVEARPTARVVGAGHLELAEPER